MRGAKRKGVRYFGPYAHAYAIRETLDLLLRTFPIRTCTKNKFDRHHRLGRPVPLRAHREVRRRRASARSTDEEYDGLVDELLDFLDGDTAPILDRLDKQMHEASDELEFERAARLRDQIVSVRKAIERQQMVDAKEEDYDVIGIVDDPLEASVQVFLVRKGRVVGRKGLVVDKVEDLDDARARRPARSSSSTATLDADDVPREILVPDEPEDPDALRGVPRPAARGARCGSACRSAAPSASCWRPSRRTRDEAFARHKLQARVRPQRPGPRAARAAGGARPARGAAAHRVLRHLEPAGHRDRRRRWW